MSDYLQTSIPSVTIRDPATLITAFEQFGRLSEQLQKSYEALDDRAASLARQLAEANSQRLQQLTEKEKIADHLEKLVSALPAGVVVIDRRGIVQSANSAAQTIFDQPLEGSRWRDIFDHSVEKVDAQDILLRNGLVITVSHQTLDVADGEIILINDVTHNRMLQSIAGRHTRLAAMGQMAAGLAHQLRTPLSTAMLYASQLNTDSLDERQSRGIHKLRTSLRYLEKLLSDMLTYARGGEFRSVSFSVNDLLVSFKSRIETRLYQSRSGLAIKNYCDNEETLRGSQDALVSVLLNLAENAIEACDENCHIELKVYRQNDHVILALSDNGPGIDEDHQLKIFEPFYTAREGGTGLGLSVAQSIVEAHNGDLLLKSSVGKGCTFFVCLPMTQEEHPLAGGEMSTTPEISE